MNNLNEYYVYCHKNSVTNEIFYVGKGKDNRAYTMSSRSSHWKNYIKKHGIPIVEILHNNLSEDESLILEKKIIRSLGRKDLNLGKLLNATDGGEGISGFNHTSDSKEKMKLSRIGKPGNNKGKSWKQKTKRKDGLMRGSYKTRIDKGKKFNDEIKNKMKIGKRNNSKPILQYDLNNVLIKEWRCAADAIDELKLKGIYNCLIGISKKSGKFIWKYKLA
jgi:hypothetical protein